MDKVIQVRFFEETFPVTNICPEVVLKMLFLILIGTDIDFLDRELWWRTFTTKKALPTIRHTELVGKKSFTTVALDLEYKTYVAHLGSVKSVALPNSFTT